MDAYDEPDFGKVHVFRSVVNMFEGRSRMQRLLNHSLGLQYDRELAGDNMDAWIQHQINIGNLVSCGCGHGRHSGRSSSFGCRHPMSSSTSNCSLSPVRVQSGDDDTERKARLLQESKKDKARAEKKKKKKLQKRKRKRAEKLKKEKQEAEKKDEDDGDDAQQSEKQEEERADSEEGATCGGAEPTASENPDSSRSEQESSDDDSSTSEELDLTSSFVSKAALIAKRQLEQKPKAVKVEKKKAVVEKECKTVEERPGDQQEAGDKALLASCGPSFDDIIKISTDLAAIGNQCASTGDYVTAVRYFTDAIKYNPTEFKLFGNRSLCFEKMHEYEKALADAELSLGICPGWVKGLFRKGRALVGLQRYDEAASALHEVLKLDRSCADAAQELMRIQIIQLMECGFTREQSSNALIIHGTVEKALEVLSKLNVHTSGAVRHTQTVPTVQVANINGVSPILSATTKLSTGGAAAPPSSPRPPTQQSSTTLLPNKAAHAFKNSPQELFPVWVGNLDYTVTEECLTNLFTKAGTVCSVKVLTNKRCAFINFTKQESCEQAIQRLNGYNLNGIRLVVRYPDRIPSGMGISASAHRAGYQQTENSFHKKNQTGSRRPV